MFALYEVGWTEYECGWGSRPGGKTYYTSKSEADKDIKKHRTGRTEKVPSIYWEPSEPKLIEVSEEFYNEICTEGKFGKEK